MNIENINERKDVNNEETWKFLSEQIQILKKETLEEYKTNPKKQTLWDCDNVYKREVRVNDNLYKIPTRLIDKPKEMTIQELIKAKEDNIKHMKELQNEIEQERIMKYNWNEKGNNKMKKQSVYRKGYDKDVPLDSNDIEYINKYEDYLKRKEEGNRKGTYEKEWNITRIKSTNSNGVNNRKDGLPGYFKWDDYSTYYQSLKNSYK